MKKFLFVFFMLLQFCFASTAFADETVSATLPTFSITLNGQAINNDYSQYPFLVYKDITYVPMTYYDARLLGLKTDWSFQHGLSIDKNDGYFYEYLRRVTDRPNSKIQTAYIADDKITVNGQIINNSKEEYPLLLFRNVTYFPLTWRFAVDEFGWQYSFSQQEGLIINNTQMKLGNPDKMAWRFTGYVEGHAGRGDSIKIQCTAPVYSNYTEDMRVGTIYRNRNIKLNPMTVSVSNMSDVEYIKNAQLECHIYKFNGMQKELVCRYFLPALDGKIEWAGFAVCDVNMSFWEHAELDEGDYSIELVYPDVFICYRHNENKSSQLIVRGPDAEVRFESVQFNITVTNS